jgi:hypothetical protein
MSPNALKAKRTNTRPKFIAPPTATTLPRQPHINCPSVLTEDRKGRKEEQYETPKQIFALFVAFCSKQFASRSSVAKVQSLVIAAS